MTIFESTVFEISKETYEFAKEIAAKAKDEFSRKRIYESVLCMKTLAEYFQYLGYSVDSENGFYKILPINEEIELNEFRSNGRCIDVRPVVNEKYILIPKSIYKYGVLPDLYAVAKYNKESSTVNFVGCIEPLGVDKQRQNEKYFIMDTSQLIQPFQIEDRIKLVKNIKISDQNHDLYTSYFVDYCDGILSDENKKELFKHLFECRGCRENFITYYTNETVLKHASEYPELLQDQTLNIVGAASVDSEKYKDFKEITLEIDKEPDQYAEDDEIEESSNYDDPLNVLYGNKSPNNEIFNHFNQKSQFPKSKKPKSMLDSVMAEIPKLPIQNETAAVLDIAKNVMDTANNVMSTANNVKDNEKQDVKERKINPALYEEDYSEGIKETEVTNNDEFDYIEDIVSPEPDPAEFNDGEDTPLFLDELNPKKQETSAEDEMLLLDAPVAPDVPEFANYMPVQKSVMPIPSDDDDVIVINDEENTDYEQLGHMIDASSIASLQRFPDIENDVDFIIDDEEEKIVVQQPEQSLNAQIMPSNIYEENDTILANYDEEDVVLQQPEEALNEEIIPESASDKIEVDNVSIKNNEAVETDETVNEEDLVHFDVEDIDIKNEDENENELIATSQDEEIKEDVPSSETELTEESPSDPKKYTINTELQKMLLGIDEKDDASSDTNVKEDAKVKESAPVSANEEKKKTSGMIPITDIPGLDAVDTQPFENHLDILDITNQLANGVSLLDDFSNGSSPINVVTDNKSGESDNALPDIGDADLSLNTENDDMLLSDNSDTLEILSDEEISDMPILQEVNENNSINNIPMAENNVEEDDELVFLDDNNNKIPSITNDDDSDDDLVLLDENNEIINNISNNEKTEDTISYNNNFDNEPSDTTQKNEDEELILIDEDETEDDTVFMRPASVVDLNDFKKIEEDSNFNKNTSDVELDDDITFVDENDSDNNSDSTNVNYEDESEYTEEDNQQNITNYDNEIAVNSYEPVISEAETDITQSTATSGLKTVQYDENGFEIEEEENNPTVNNTKIQDSQESYTSDDEQNEFEYEDSDDSPSEADNEENVEFENDEESEFDEETEDEEESEENTGNNKGFMKKAIIVGIVSLIILGGAGGGLFFYMQKAKQEQMQNIAALNNMNEEPINAENTENTDNNLDEALNLGGDDIQLPEEGENKDLAEKMPPQENTENKAEEEEQLPKPPAPAEQKVAQNAEKPVAKDMNQAMTNVFSDNPASLKITKTSWAVAPYIAADAEFKNFLQTSGRSIQSQIKKNLISVKDNTYSENTKIQINFADGAVSDITIAKSSGSKQIDDIVLQSVKEYMATAQMPKLSENSIQAIKKANGGYNFKITFSVSF